MKIISSTGNFYEIDLLLKTTELLNKRGGGLIIDVGANIGNHALYWALKHDNPILAIEGNDLTYQILAQNIALNGYVGRVHTRQSLMGATEGERFSFVSLDDRNHGADYAVRDKAGEYVSETLDGVLEELYPDHGVALIKLDVERMESEVLKGASKTIMRSTPYIVVEAQEEYYLKKCMAQLPGYRILGKFCYTPTYILGFS